MGVEQTFIKRDAQERCLTSLYIGEMQIITTMRYYFLEWLKLKRLTIPNIGEDVGEMSFSYIDEKI